MNLFAYPKVTNSFLSPNSALPIVGICLNTAYKRPLIQAKLAKDNFVNGQPVEVKNIYIGGHSSGNNAGQGLAPNVMSADTITTNLSGFIVESPNSVYIDGDEGSRYFKNQIVYVALLGSGAEMYLPVKSSDFTEGEYVIGSDFQWDNSSGLITKGKGTFNLLNITLMSQPVEGLQFYYDSISSSVKQKKILVIKVKL